MTNRKIIATVLVAASALFTLPAVHAEGPMSEDFSKIISHAAAAQSSGQSNDAAGFVEHAEAALAQAKAQNDLQTSPRLQRIISALRSAVNKGKGGDMDGANAALADAMDDLK